MDKRLRKKMSFKEIILDKPVITKKGITRGITLKHEGKLVDFCFSDVTIVNKGIKLLDNINGYVKSGEMLALMGPSGCGKTTLLNYLSFRRSLIGLNKNKMTGSVSLDGIELQKKDRSTIAYVTQEVNLFANITLLDTLIFYARIKMDPRTTDKERYERIEEVVDLMDLSNCLNTVIGSDTLRGLSGGERKRASVCVELLIDPVILFLDEPTSSLDSSMAMTMMRLINKLAIEKNTIVIASIHQPSSNLFHIFDRLLLLCTGKAAYFGKMENLKEHLTSLNLSCPRNWNIADHVLNVLEENFDKMKLAYKAPVMSASTCLINDDREKNVKKKTWGINCNQLIASFVRSQKLTNATTLNVSNIAYMIFTAILSSIFWYQTPFTEANIQTLYGLMFYFSSVIYYQALDINLYKFETDKIVIRHEMISKMYPLWMYYVTKTISSIPFMLVTLCIQWTIIYFAAGYPKSPYFLLSLSQFFFLFLASQAISLLVAAFGLTIKANAAIADLIFTVSYVLGGYYNQNLSVWLQKLQNISIFYQTFITQRLIYFTGYDGVECSSRVSYFLECIQGNSKATLKGMTEFLSDSINYKYLLVIQCIILVLCHVMAFQILKYTLSRPARSTFILVKIRDFFKKKMSYRRQKDEPII